MNKREKKPLTYVTHTHIIKNKYLFKAHIQNPNKTEKTSELCVYSKMLRILNLNPVVLKVIYSSTRVYLRIYINIT